MTDYIRPLLRMCILFALVFTVGVLAKPTRASANSANQDCCQTCDNKYAACVSACTTAGCRLGCQRQLNFCIEVCPACLVE
jgi:hypothetical protein